MRKNVASQYVAFQMNSTTDGSPVTAGTPTVYYTIDGGTQGTGAGTSTHEGNGQWSYAPTQAETNGNHVAYTMAISGAISQTVNTWPVAFDTSQTNLLVDTVAISGDTTAADNLEATYDGTGYIDDNAPATQSQLSGIANVGSASNKEFTGQVLTTPATTTGGSYTDTKQLDGTYMYWDAVTGGFNAELTSNIGSGIPTGVKITGYMNGANDAVRVQLYDYVGSDWETVGTWTGGGSTVNQVFFFDAFINQVGTGANKGNIRLRLYNDNGVVDTALTSANVYIDQVFVEFTTSIASAVDAVYFDSNASNTGTSSSDGVPGNPVSTEAAVNTLLAARNQYKVNVALESTITFTTSHTDELWEGVHWNLNFGSQNLSGAHFIGAECTGTAASGVTDPIDFNHCRFGTCTVPQLHAINCTLMSGTITFNEPGDYLIADSHSMVAGSTTPIIDTGAAIANVNLSMPNYQQGIEIRNLNAAGTDNFSLSGIGQVIYAASSSGTVNQRGSWKVTNTGGVTITYDDNSQNIIDIETDTADMQPKLGTPVTSISADIATVDSNVDAILVDIGTTIPATLTAIQTRLLGVAIEKNAAYSNFEFLMVLTSDHVTPATGLTVTGQRSIDGGAFGAVSGTITEVSNGIYQFDALAADTNGDTITWRFSAGTADDTFVTFKTIT